MKRALLAAAMGFACAGACAQEEKRELIYGAEMMTRAEREDYRQDLKRAKTPDEAKAVEERHRDRMQRRAKARVETLDAQGLLEKKK